ncbi:VOC family protein [Poritiphilus flavus]|uniref:VOC family protein n=1 Tax=Poritiphilus flavus TaxID=2697053 RepID=A0A6L9EIZ6_9FLAO|nr:VOC family protein [Poritiphilus flavus]NAS14149.1 VOC family protein [Poritiphilus flavus]
MTTLLPYIAFPGTCKEAMEFYSKTFGGKLVKLQTFAEAPMEVPEEVGHRIFDSEMIAGKLRIKASDDLPGHEVQAGTNISLFVSFADKAKKEEIFAALSENGKVLFPLTEDFGMLKDPYGIQWMFVSDKAQ